MFCYFVFGVNCFCLSLLEIFKLFKLFFNKVGNKCDIILCVIMSIIDLVVLNVQ